MTLNKWTCWLELSLHLWRGTGPRQPHTLFVCPFPLAKKSQLWSPRWQAAIMLGSHWWFWYWWCPMSPSGSEPSRLKVTDPSHCHQKPIFSGFKCFFFWYKTFTCFSLCLALIEDIYIYSWTEWWFLPSFSQYSLSLISRFPVNYVVSLENKVSLKKVIPMEDIKCMAAKGFSRSARQLTI